MEIDKETVKAVALAISDEGPDRIGPFFCEDDGRRWKPDQPTWADWTEEAKAAITAYKRAREAQGYVEVPVEALQRLHDFIRDEYGCTKSQALDGEFVSGEAREVWKDVCAMLAARPQKEVE